MIRKPLVWASAGALLFGAIGYAIAQGTSTSPLLNDLAQALSPNEQDQAGDITTAATGDYVLCLDVSDTPDAINYCDGDNLLEIQGVTATASEINGAADVGSRVISISDAATYTVLAANTGKAHVIPELTADITIDLPTAAAGLEYTFIMGGVATDAQDWIFDTTAAANFYLGGLQHLDSDEPGSGSTLVPVYPDGDSNDIMTILTPQAGTRVHVVCDGTNWIVNGVAYSATAPTFAD